MTFAEAAAVFVLHPTGSARIQTNQSGLCGRSTAAQRRQAQILPNWIYKTFFKASGLRGVYFWGGAKDEKINSTQLLRAKIIYSFRTNLLLVWIDFLVSFSDLQLIHRYCLTPPHPLPH